MTVLVFQASYTKQFHLTVGPFTATAQRYLLRNLQGFNTRTDKYPCDDLKLVSVLDFNTSGAGSLPYTVYLRVSDVRGTSRPLLTARDMFNPSH